MLSSLRVGDDVVTIGGIHGKITALRENVIWLQVTEDLEMQFSRMAVASKERPGDEEQSAQEPEMSQ